MTLKYLVWIDTKTLETCSCIFFTLILKDLKEEKRTESST